MKKGLVMEGGAMRGLFTAGVIDVLMENDITFDGAVGVSAGAAFGCNYKSKQIGRVLRYNKRFCNDPRFCSLKSLITTGNLYNAEFDYHTLPNELDVYDGETYVSNPMEFWVVCTDIRKGKPVYHRSDVVSYDELEWIRASASIPLASRPVELKGHLMLDGGITDFIPLRFFQHKGYDRNVVILTQPRDYVKQPNKLLPILKIAFRRYPETYKKMANRHLRYNRMTKYCFEQEAAGNILIIQPETSLNIGSSCKDPDELQRVYDLGRDAAEKALDKVKEFLGETESHE